MTPEYRIVRFLDQARFRVEIRVEHEGHSGLWIPVVAREFATKVEAQAYIALRTPSNWQVVS
jgi:hypothetical protein